MCGGPIGRGIGLKTDPVRVQIPSAHFDGLRGESTGKCDGFLDRFRCTVTIEHYGRSTPFAGRSVESTQWQHVMKSKCVNQLQAMQSRPAGPGQVLKDLLDEKNISLTEAAACLGVNRGTVSCLVNGHTSLSMDMANRLGIFLGNEPAFWLRLQQQVDMWDLLHGDPKEYDVQPLKLKPQEIASEF